MRRQVGIPFAIATLIMYTVGAAGNELSRRSPIVEAVAKTRDGIVTVRVEKQGSFGRATETIGTAVVVDERGYAVTNRHVVTSASKLTTFLADGTAVPAQIVIEDAQRDLAILKLEGRTFAALPLGPSSDLMVGETVVAIGNPYGYVNTVSRGIISALGREITMPGGEKIRGLIQTDAPINPGSSGGPLININGELIGINVAMREGAQGIAFAITSDTLKEFLSQHLSAKRFTGLDHGLGCAERVEADGPNRQKVVVSYLDRRGLAAGAGVKPGDRIVAVGTRGVANRFDVERAMWDCRPGTQLHFRIERGGQQLDLSLTVPKQEQSAGK